MEYHITEEGIQEVIDSLVKYKRPAVNVVHRLGMSFSLIKHNNIVMLDLTYSGVREIPKLPESVTRLICSTCPIERFAPLPSKLEWFECRQCDLRELPPLPDSIMVLNACQNPGIRKLPSHLPSKLLQLLVEDCSLTKLPPLQSSLLGLWVARNNIESLPSLPTNLWHFGCSDNKIKVLPKLPSSLLQLTFSGNQLTELPISLLHCKNLVLFISLENKLKFRHYIADFLNDLIHNNHRLIVCKIDGEYGQFVEERKA